MLVKLTFQLENGHVDTIIHQRQPLKYSKSELRSLQPSVVCRPDIELPRELKPRKRVRKGGVKNRLRKRGQRLCLPITITGNTQSLNNKIDELQARVKYQSEFRHASLLGITETWRLGEGRRGRPVLICQRALLPPKQHPPDISRV